MLLSLCRSWCFFVRPAVAKVHNRCEKYNKSLSLGLVFRIF